MRALKKTLIAASIGNMLEFYNFTLFGLFLPVLSPLFFPKEDPLSSLLYGYLFFAVGFFAYPVGAILFGYIGDKIGRKRALSLSILAMAFPTACIGLLPSYASLGILSPILLFICRFLQGIFAGGEYNGAGVFVIEHAGKNRGGISGAIVAAAGTLGAFIATIMGFIFSAPGLPSDIWRIPFLLGAFVAIIGSYLRKELEESPEFIEKAHTHKRKNPFIGIFKHHIKAFICSIGIGALGTVPFYLIIGYLNIYFVTQDTLSLFEMMALNMGLTFFCALSLPFVGNIADKVGHSRIMIMSALTLFSYSFLFFIFLQQPSISIIYLAEFILLGISQGYVAPLNAFISKLFPVHIRYTATSLGYCIGMALFGGTTPYISAFLVKWTHNSLSPSFYLMLVCILGLVSVIVAVQKPKSSLEYP